MKNLILLVLVLFILPLNSYSGPFTLQEKSYNLKIGLGMSLKTNMRFETTINYKNNNPNFTPFPFARLKFSRLEIEPDKIRYVFFRNTFISSDMRVKYSGHEYNHATMAHRHKSIFGGFTLRILMFRLKFLHDIQDRSSGSLARLSVLFPLYFSSQTKLILKVGQEYWDHKYIDYYFGVKKNEITTNRPLYIGKNQLSMFGKVIYTRYLTPHLILRMSFLFRKWDGSLIDSPTVQTTKIYDGLAAMVYEF